MSLDSGPSGGRVARTDFLPAMVCLVTRLIAHLAGSFRGRYCWKRKRNTMDRVGAVQDGLLMLNIVVCASANPERDPPLELLLPLMEALSDVGIRSQSGKSRLYQA